MKINSRLGGEMRGSQVPILWRRGGVIVPPFGGADAPGQSWSAHCQMPTPLSLGDGMLRIYYTTRDPANRSHVLFADVAGSPPYSVIRRSSAPCLAPGPVGHFDAAGVMPTSVLRRGSEVWLYYIGWTVRADVPYHNAIGLAVSADGGETFTRRFAGPVVATAANEPLFCSTADVIERPDGWLMWYASTTEWRVVDDKLEPRYHLKVATSDDGLTWTHGARVAVDYADESEGAVARATVWRADDRFHMWFCSRAISGYRTEHGKGYRLGYAWSDDGLSWTRESSARIFSNDPQAGDPDEHMQAYPAVVDLCGHPLLLYNGNEFGQTGICVATPDDSPRIP